MFRFSLKTRMAMTVSILVTLLMTGLASLIISNFERRFRESIATQQFALISEMARDVDETVQRAHTALIGETVRYSVIAVIAGILISILIVWRGMEIINAPLLQLNRHIRAISDLDGMRHEIRIDSTDEIGELAASFNNMMRMISEKREELFERVVQLEASLAGVKQLEGIIPICMHCKSIRDDKEIWLCLEQYLTEHSKAQFSHGICPVCLEKHYGLPETPTINKG